VRCLHVGFSARFLSSLPRGFTFWSSASEGAILATPDGAQSQDLENITGFMKYLAENIESWYRFANGPRGREARNGDLRLVVGFDKTVSWGMAAFSNTSGASGVAQPSQCQFNFKPALEVEPEPSICKYTWEYSGLAEVRAGPASEEIAMLREEDANPPRSGKYTNQCIFVRTMNTKLGDERWNRLCEELGTSHLDENWHLFRNENGCGFRPGFGPSNSHSSTSRTRGDSSSTRQDVIQASALSDEVATRMAFDLSSGQLSVTKPPAAIVRIILDCI